MGATPAEEAGASTCLRHRLKQQRKGEHMLNLIHFRPRTSSVPLEQWIPKSNKKKSKIKQTNIPMMIPQISNQPSNQPSESGQSLQSIFDSQSSADTTQPIQHQASKMVREYEFGNAMLGPWRLRGRGGSCGALLSRWCILSCASEN